MAYVIRDSGNPPHYQYWTAVVGKSPAVARMWTGDIRRAKHYATQKRAQQAMKRSRIGTYDIVSTTTSNTSTQGGL